MKNKIMGLIMCGILFAVCVTGCTGRQQQSKQQNQKVSYSSLMKNWNALSKEEALALWYTEKSDEKWLKTMAKDFEKAYGKKVELVFYDGNTFYEDMNTANQQGKGPDVYLCGNDQLELVRNLGLAEENTAFDSKLWEENYPEVAKAAVTFKNQQYGYPVYFDTYCLVYDSKLLEKAPASMDDILSFADEYSDTGATKAILRWDVADPYINTMFLASYADIFGEQGDDSTSFDICNEKTIEAMKYFNSVSEYMWMDKNNISHDIVKNRIKEGTLVLGLCKSDILQLLDEANQSGEVAYKLSYLPSLTADLSTKAYSTTYIAMVNPYTSDENLANLFACYLSYGNPKALFEGNGKLSVVDLGDDLDENQSILYAQYLNSTPVPKVMLFGDYISESGITYDAIWDGKDVEEQLSALQEKMKEKM